MAKILDENEQTLAKQEALETKKRLDDDRMAAVAAKENIEKKVRAAEKKMKLDDLLNENGKSIDELASDLFGKWKADFQSGFEEEKESLMMPQKVKLESLEKDVVNPVVKELESRKFVIFGMWESGTGWVGGILEE